MEPGTPKRIPRGRVGRVAPLAGLAGRTAGEAVVASLRKKRGTGDAEAFHARNAERYAQRLGHSRGVLLKAGQIMSMVIPESGVEGDHRGIYRRAFAKLFDNAPPMPAAVAVRTIEAELGRPLTDLFASFDPKPLAAASIGQVHAATLHDGTRVAVKVQYPGVEQAIRADLANTQLLGTFVQLILTVVPNMSRMDVRAIAREISERIGEEIDYLAEAENQREFAAAYRGHPFIRIPEVHDELTTRRVLTMQFDNGIRYDEATRAPQELRDRWAEAIYRFVWEGLARLGINNSDAHPGNFLFHSDGSVTFLDFGCVKRFSTDQVEIFLGIFRYLLEGDAEGLHRWAVESGYLDPQAAVDPRDLLALVRNTYVYLTEPQPFTFTPEFVSAMWREAFCGPQKEVMRKLSSPAWNTMLMRMGTGTFAVWGGLRATGHWKALLEESWFDGPVVGDYGRLSAEFWAART
ncbi:MAG TPA: AarF/ABC1/UbiB kinase family protein [Sporichthyaceae bacterium]|jgi:predicted unusual protein kinase regulating ubiquinone biosynthesis (AarF/ABC1/UbiB family)|nr:AarF/ABC1/UbiB kinase family protein [Sporichthyaceae bacterium]